MIMPTVVGGIRLDDVNCDAAGFVCTHAKNPKSHTCSFECPLYTPVFPELTHPLTGVLESSAD